MFFCSARVLFGVYETCSVARFLDDFGVREDHSELCFKLVHLDLLGSSQIAADAGDLRRACLRFEGFGGELGS